MKAVSTRVVILGILLAALLLAGVVSFYAAGSPDGLNRVALDEGFSSTEEEHGAADGPLAGYAVAAVDDERLSGGLAGAAGVLVVLVVTTGLTLVVRRRALRAPSSDN